MTDPTRSTDPLDEVAELRRRVARLERRHQRERAAREEAERIAEAGLLDLWKANRLLEERVAERTVELEATLAATRAAADAKERFLAELGHELNTPLHNVLGLLELIEPRRLTDEDRRRIEEIRRHAGELADLLHGLVELASADGAPTPGDLTTLAAGSWLDDLVDAWSRAAAQRAQLLLPSTRGQLGEVRLDWRRLRRAADAVLENVTVHAGPGPVEVGLSGDAETLRLSVVDAGPGITPDLAASVTEPFVSGPGTPGIGIGLAVADRLMAAGGGSLRIRIADGRTAVELTLPRGRAAADAS